jgi:2,3-bisphosphoglycerate-independent phosphoglycerate mutase
MKYAIIIPDGCADDPQESLGGKTPLQAAYKPNMDRIAKMGFVGLSNNVPASLTPASDVATLSLFGYDPLVVYTGRAPLEAVAMGIKLGPNDWAIRCNLVTIENEEMRDFTAGHIANDEGKELIAAVQKAFGGSTQGLSDVVVTGRPRDTTVALLDFHAGVSYRNILVFRPTKGPAPFTEETKTQPPHDIPDKPIAGYLPQGPGADLLRGLMQESRKLFQGHPANRARRVAGKKPATQIWLWGQGHAPQLQPFAQIHGKRGAIISAVDLVRGVGMLLGWRRIDVAGATGYLDTDYAAKGRAAVAALPDHDLVCVHVEAPDEASHEGKVEEKIKALEEIDRHIVGPLLNALAILGEWRILVSPDHRTPLKTRAHGHGPVPFAMAGTGIAAAGQASYDEVTATAGPLKLVRGHELMPRFLN